MYTNYLISDDYLMHYGVKGMKWGVRHDPERSAQRARNKAAKGRLNTARKNFNKDYNSWYRQAYKPASYVNGSKANKEYNRRYDQAIKSAQAVNKAKTNYRNVAGKGRDRLDTAAQIAKGVGVVAAAAAVGYGSVYLATNPAVASSVSKAMKTGLGNIARNAKRGASYMKNTRYNKAVQLASPDAASKAAFKRSTYKAMNRAAAGRAKAYGDAMSGTGKMSVGNGARKVAEGVSKAGTKVRNAAQDADRAVRRAVDMPNVGKYQGSADKIKIPTRGDNIRRGIYNTKESVKGSVKNAAGNVKESAGRAKDSAYISGYNKYADARTAASRTARRASTDAKIIREGVKDSARNASNYVRTDARMAGQRARNTVDSAREGVSNARSKARTTVSNRTTQYKNRNNPRLRSNNSARSRRYTNNR